MTKEKKIEQFDVIQQALWDLARHGNLVRSSIATMLIRHLRIESPEGDDPDSVSRLTPTGMPRVSRTA